MRLFALNSGSCSCIDSTSNQDSNHVVKGLVVAVGWTFDISCVSAPTITVTTKNNPVTLLNIATDQDGWRYPRTPVHDPANGNVIANVYSLGIPIDDIVNVAISDGEDGDSVEITLLLQE